MKNYAVFDQVDWHWVYSSTYPANLHISINKVLRLSCLVLQLRLLGLALRGWSGPKAAFGDQGSSAVLSL